MNCLGLRMRQWVPFYAHRDSTRRVMSASKLVRRRPISPFFLVHFTYTAARVHFIFCFFDTGSVLNIKSKWHTQSCSVTSHHVSSPLVCTFRILSATFGCDYLYAINLIHEWVSHSGTTVEVPRTVAGDDRAFPSFCCPYLTLLDSFGNMSNRS